MSSSSKRKREDHPNAGDFLHPGEWRNTPKRSKSPSASGASTPDARYSCSPFTFDPSFEQSTGSAWTGLESALRSLHLTTKICPSLSLAAEDLTSSLPIFEAAAKGHRDYDALATGLKKTVDQLTRHLNEAASESIVDTITDIAEAIWTEIESIKTPQSHSLSRRLLGASTTADDSIRSYRRIEQLFRRIQAEASINILNIIDEPRVKQQLNILRHSSLARFNSELSTEVSRRGCTKDTRTTILEESMAWSENPDTAKIYWMNGMAGTGKTTIAYSLCERLDARKQLAASFFCTRESPEYREAERIIPTIAHQLAQRFAPIRYFLSQKLEEGPGISYSSLSHQFDSLLKKPLLAAKDQLSNNLVIVLDALDECSDPHIVELFLGLLFRSALELPIKFFVTSRPEPAIRNRMMPESERSRSILILHEVELSLVQADIELYLREELASIAPADEDVTELAEHAVNLFIYAATAVRYIRPVGKAVNSKARLKSMLAVNAKSNTALSAIDALYIAILTAAIDDEELTPEERNQIRMVLRTAICTCEPIPIRTLALLSGLDDKGDTVAALQPLRSVLHVSDYSGLVTTLHESFRSCMFDQARSGAFHCDKVAHSQFLAERCFRIMENQLRFNICSIRSSFTANDKIPELEGQIKNNISDELSYACRFWVDHLSETHHTDSLLLLAYEFLSQRLLFWMQVLSLNNYIVVGVTMLTKLNSWLSQANLNIYANLLELASDAQGFVATYALGPPSAYVSHIYLSVLPFSPPSSCVRSQYLSQFKGLINVSETTLDRVGKASFDTWASTGSSRCAAFSPNGGRVFLGDEKGMISVQNSYDGGCIIPPFKAHKQAVTSLGVSSDGMQIVSGSHDTTLSIWNAHTGSLLFGPFKGHSDRVASVAFSPDAILVVSGSDDCTVSIWNIISVAAPMKSLRGHQKAVNSVAFSPDGTRVISGSSDCTFRLWDVSNGDTIFIRRDHGGAVTAVQFTPNDFYIISGCGDNIIRVWNARDGTLFCQSQNAHSGGITSIAVSPDGCNIVSGSWDRTLCVWDTQTCDLISGPFEGHTESVKCVGFSGDGTHSMSASDKTVQIWDFQQQQKPQIEKGSVTDTISDLRLIVSRSQAHVAIWDDNSRTEIHVWDLRTTTHIDIPTSADIELLLFSLDGARIHLLHASGTICTWDTQTGELLDGPHRFTSFEKWDSVACSSDGTRIATCYKNKVELWHVKSDRSIAVCETGCDLPRVIFSQDGSRFATSSGYSSDVWDGADGAHVAGPLPVRVFDLSPDGTYLCCWSNRFQLMHINTGEMIDMQTGYVSNLIFTPDGLHIAVRQDFRTIDIFNTCGQKVNSFEFQDPSSYISNLLGYSSDGWLLFSQNLSGEVKGLYVWRVHVDYPPFTIDPDGWVLDHQQRPLLWVPENIRSNFPGCGRVIISDTKEVLQSVDYSGMFVGDDWSQCYIHYSQ